VARIQDDVAGAPKLGRNIESAIDGGRKGRGEGNPRILSFSRRDVPTASFLSRERADC